MLVFTLYSSGITVLVSYNNVIAASLVGTYASIVYNDNGTTRTVIHKLEDEQHYSLVYQPVS